MYRLDKKIFAAISDTIVRRRTNSWLKGGYAPERYWRKRGRGYYSTHQNLSQSSKAFFTEQESAWKSQLQSMSPSSALELGCGYGRMLRVAESAEIPTLAGLDISPDQIKNAAKLVPTANLSVFDIQTKLPFDDDSFDLVYTSEVLMHLPDISQVIAEMRRVSRKWVVHIENPGGEGNSEWEFSHDLDATYERLGETPQVSDIGVQKMIVVELESSDSAGH